MAAAPFAALESRLNQAAITRLSNAVADFNGELVCGMFDTPNQLATVGQSGMASAQPTLTVASADVPPRVINTYYRWCFEPFDAIDLQVTVNGAAYKIVGLEPDGTGITRLVLELVSAP